MPKGVYVRYGKPAMPRLSMEEFEHTTEAVESVRDMLFDRHIETLDAALTARRAVRRKESHG